MKTVLVTGVFNVIHPGHLRVLRFAKECGDHLVVAVLSDRRAGPSAMVPENLRLEGVRSNSYVSSASILDDSIEDLIRRLKPDFVVKGKEHEGHPNVEEAVLREYGGRLIFSAGESVFSSVELLRNEILKADHRSVDFPHDYLRRHAISTAKMVETVAKFNQLRVCVVGDLIVDEYIACDALGMSQEDTTIVVTPIDSTRFIGGAGIVAAHAAGLGASVHFVSVAGSDDCSQFAKDRLAVYGVNSTLITDESRPTTLKQRYRSKGKTLLRVSRLSQAEVSIEIQQSVVQAVEGMISQVNLLVFSDFSYGCLPQSVVERIADLARRHGVMVVADSQASSQLGDISRFQGMRLITPTEREARLSLKNQSDGLVTLAEKLKVQSAAASILLKLGEEGVLVHTTPDSESGWHTDQIPALNSSPKDVAGAGDSMLITAALCLAAGANMWESAVLGSIAAAVQVGRVGNIPLTSDDLLAELRW